MVRLQFYHFNKINSEYEKYTFANNILNQFENTDIINEIGNENDYKTGFSIYKAIAIVIPALLYRLTNFLNKYYSLRIYLFYIC